MKKRNPNDTTFRNINALKKRVKEVERQIGWLKSINKRYALTLRRAGYWGKY